MAAPKNRSEKGKQDRFAPAWESEKEFLTIEPPKKVKQATELPKEADDEQR